MRAAAGTVSEVDSVVVEAAARVDLTADLPVGERVAVQVHVRDAGAHGTDELAELAGRDALRGRAHDILRAERSAEHRRCGGGGPRAPGPPGRGGCGGGGAGPARDAA